MHWGVHETLQHINTPVTEINCKDLMCFHCSLLLLLLFVMDKGFLDWVGCVEYQQKIEVKIQQERNLFNEIHLLSSWDCRVELLATVELHFVISPLFKYLKIKFKFKVQILI